MEVDPRNDVVGALGTGIRSLGGRPTLLRKLGTSDLNLAVPVWECPAAAYGPGDSHLDHTDAESLAIDELRRSFKVLRTAFHSLATRPRAESNGTAGEAPPATGIAPRTT